MSLDASGIRGDRDEQAPSDGTSSSPVDALLSACTAPARAVEGAYSLAMRRLALEYVRRESEQLQVKRPVVAEIAVLIGGLADHGIRGVSEPSSPPRTGESDAAGEGRAGAHAVDGPGADGEPRADDGEPRADGHRPRGTSDEATDGSPVEV